MKSGSESPPGGVVLYSGRWRSKEMHDLVENHKQRLILPLNLSVVAVGFANNLCRLGSNQFASTISRMWGMDPDRIRVTMMYDEDVPRFRMPQNLSAWKQSQVKAYAVQFHHVKVAVQVASAWRAFDFYVRARIDVLFDRTPRFDSARLNGIVYAHAVPTFKNWASNRSTLVWRDWLYVASFDGISHIANVVDPIISPRERCMGACPEEQIVLQLRRHKYELVPFRDPLTLTRVPKKEWCQPGPL